MFDNSRLFGLLLAALVLPAILSPDMVRADNGLPWKSNKPTNELPREIDGVGISEKPGQEIDQNLKFTDESGQSVTLGKYLNRGIPVILSPVYFSCPNLCNFHLNGVVDALKLMSLSPGKDFELVAISIDPKETTEVASKKRENYLKLYGHPDGSRGFHFLTGSVESVKAITDQVGFKYKWDDVTKQWAHSSAAILLTPAGRISRYLHGIVFNEKTFRLSLVEASNGKIGQLIDHVLLFCFQYDPQKKGYAFYAYNITRVAFGLTVLALAGFLISFFIRQRREPKKI